MTRDSLRSSMLFRQPITISKFKAMHHRRNFLKHACLLGSAIGFSSLTAKNTIAENEADNANIVDSPPLLQNPSADGMTVVWAVKDSATGYVEYGKTEKLGNKTAMSSGGLASIEELFLHARLSGLESGAKYFYRTVTLPAKPKGTSYEIGEAIYGPTCSFRTPTARASTASFAVINDTHQRTETLKVLTTSLAELKADFTIWNGDLVNDYYNRNQAVENIARPAGVAFATESPLLFVRGNHDYRGPWVRNLPKLLTPWLQKRPEDHDLMYNFALRHGPIAMIGLDTGEDKPDAHPAFSGMIHCEPHKHLQAEWLKRVLKQPEIATAPYLIAFCHIPLFDSRPNANGGDSMKGYAAYSRLGAKLWGPFLKTAGAQVVITAHQHAYRHDAASSTNCGWDQIVGGGPGGKQPATLIHAKADNRKMILSIHQPEINSIKATFEYMPRKIN